MESFLCSTYKMNLAMKECKTVIPNSNENKYKSNCGDAEIDENGGCVYARFVKS